MLLIGDIHITSRFQDRIILELKNYIQKNPDEKNIVFLGDFVYHFSYDRTALLALYNFFIELFSQGKNLYILAGNHDRLGQHFVFEEGQKAFEIIKNIENFQTPGSIKFITKPELSEIEGKQVLFMPFVLHGFLRPENISQKRTHLLDSNNKNEKLSGQINEFIRQKIQENPDLTLIHHYYFNKTKFPNQKSQFSYKDIAISEEFFKSNIKIISGHLHAPFAYENYFCLGSVRSTSSLEINQIKCLAKYNPQNQKLSLQEVAINPYIFLEIEEGQQNLFDSESIKSTIDQKLISDFLSKLHQEFVQQLSLSSQRNIDFKPAENISYRSVSLSIKVSDLDYSKMDSYIEPELRKQFQDVKLKKQVLNSQQAIEKFETEGKNLSVGFANRKDMLKKYLMQNYAEDYPKYEAMLQQLKLI